MLKREADKVIAITPMSYPEYFEKYIRRTDVIAVELQDTAENIFDSVGWEIRRVVIHDVELLVPRREVYI